MLDFIKKLFGHSDPPPPARGRPRPLPGAGGRPARKPAGAEDDTGPRGTAGNAPIRKRFVREDSGTHETLRILDESVLEDDDEEAGIDPYNTGNFDRSKNWDKRFRN